MGCFKLNAGVWKMCLVMVLDWRLYETGNGNVWNNILYDRRPRSFGYVCN